MILRFVVDLAVPFTNNQAERDLRPVKIQQRTGGGTWRTLTGLADFALIQSYLSARKWGIDSIDALTRLQGEAQSCFCWSRAGFRPLPQAEDGE
jgi:transposase